MGLSCPVAAQSSRLASDNLKVPFGDGQIFVRNKRPEAVASFKSDRLVLFVRGATYPSTAFDLPLGGKSWMHYAAERGFDTYALDLPSYGRSTRAPAMELAAEDNAPLTRGSEAVNAVGSVVNHILQRRGAEKLTLMAGRGAPPSSPATPPSDRRRSSASCFMRRCGCAPRRRSCKLGARSPPIAR